MARLDLDLKEHFDKIRSQYETSSSKNTFNALIMGDPGSGKTFGMRHARGPVLIHSFDSGGSKGLQKYIDLGRVIVDTSFENDDPSSPTAFRKWEEEFMRLNDSGAFESIGTYVIDSLSSMSDSLMNAVLHANGRAPRKGKVGLNHRSGNIVAIPELRDYQIQMVTLVQELALCTAIPCDFIAIAHLKYDKDEVTGKRSAGPNLTGQLTTRIPGLFDEVLIATSKATSGDAEYSYLTQTDGLLQGRTRLGAEGVFKKYEPQNLQTLLKKAGFDITDKPLFK